ncbi:MAG: ABC transporter substrate-binding protein, partial [Acidaminococcaceae bacterium]
MNKGLLKLAAVSMMTALMVASLAGCGGKANKNTIKIGLLNEMTGGNATIGTAAANGAKMAIKEINAKGGVLGKQLEAVAADNKSEPAEAANAMTKLLSQDNVVAVTGTFSSSNAIAAASVAEVARKPYLIAGATNPKV